MTSALGQLEQEFKVILSNGVQLDCVRATPTGHLHIWAVSAQAGREDTYS